MKRKVVSSILVVIVLATAIILAINWFNEKLDISMRQSSRFPSIESSQKLYVIDEKDVGSDALMVMVQSLQGIVAQNKAQIYIQKEQKASQQWLKDMLENEEREVEYVTSPWDLIDRFSDQIADSGYVLYELGTPSVNVACTVSGVMKYIAIDESIEEIAKLNGLKLRENVKEKDELWAFRQYKDLLNTTLVISQPYTNVAFRDYGIATKSIFFYDDDTDAVFEVYSHMDTNGFVMGWYRDEVTGVGISSMLEMITLAADHAYNLSVYASSDTNRLKQTSFERYAKKGENVHYVTLMMSDGDNIQWYTNGMLLDDRYYSSNYRGDFPAGWSIPPTLIDLAPTIMNYAYSNQTKNDEFVAAVSGVGYINPSSYDDVSLTEFVQMTADYMMRADLQYVQILDGGMNDEVIAAFSKEKQIQGAFYMIGNRYCEGDGQVKWANNKPFIAFKESLWDEDPIKVAERINGYKIDIESVEGYTAVNVHPWSHTWDDVNALIKHLDGDVKVVTPGEFIELMKENIKRQH